MENRDDSIEVKACAAPPCSPDWKRVAWRQLEKGEIIQSGDWFDACNDGWRDEPIWKPVERRIGEPAPDPAYPSHTTFRRIIQANAQGMERRAVAPNPHDG
jgi:hypothetical protein